MWLIAPWLRTGQRPENEDSAGVLGPARSRKLKMYFCSEPTFKLGSNEGQRHEQTITLMSLPKSFRDRFVSPSAQSLYGCVVKLWWCKWYYFLNSQLLADARWDGVMLTSSHPGPLAHVGSHDVTTSRGAQGELTHSLIFVSRLYMSIIIDNKLIKNYTFQPKWRSCVLWPQWRLPDPRPEAGALQSLRAGPGQCRHGGATAAQTGRAESLGPVTGERQRAESSVRETAERDGAQWDEVTWDIMWGHDPCPSDNTRPRPGPGLHWPQWWVSCVPQGGRCEDRDQTHHWHQPLHCVHLHRGQSGLWEQTAQLPINQRLL